MARNPLFGSDVLSSVEQGHKVIRQTFPLKNMFFETLTKKTSRNPKDFER